MGKLPITKTNGPIASSIFMTFQLTINLLVLAVLYPLRDVIDNQRIKRPGLISSAFHWKH